MDQVSRLRILTAPRGNDKRSGIPRPPRQRWQRVQVHAQVATSTSMSAHCAPDQRLTGAVHLPCCQSNHPAFKTPASCTAGQEGLLSTSGRRAQKPEPQSHPSTRNQHQYQTPVQGEKERGNQQQQEERRAAWVVSPPAGPSTRETGCKSSSSAACSCIALQTSRMKTHTARR
ncbi:hypothetical protein GN956_G13731 [Arapaima gigas]